MQFTTSSAGCRTRRAWPRCSASELGLDGTGRLLDVGCGPGSLTVVLAPLFASATGLDADPQMIAEARRIAADAGGWQCRVAAVARRAAAGRPGRLPDGQVRAVVSLAGSGSGGPARAPHAGCRPCRRPHSRDDFPTATIRCRIRGRPGTVSRSWSPDIWAPRRAAGRDTRPASITPWRSKRCSGPVSLPLSASRSTVARPSSAASTRSWPRCFRCRGRRHTNSAVDSAHSRETCADCCGPRRSANGTPNGSVASPSSCGAR